MVEKRWINAVALMAGAVLLAPGGAFAQRRSSTGLSSADVTFMRQAARVSIAEVRLGSLAATKGSSDFTREFAERMIRDHRQANERLTELARQKGVTLPTAPDQKHQAVANRLNRLSGPRFDQLYAQQMVRDHTAAVRLFARAHQRTKDPDLKAWIAGALPHLREHLGMARHLQGNALAAVVRQKQAARR